MKELKIIEVKSEIGAGTRGASLGVDAIKIAALDFGSRYFKKHNTLEIPNENHLLLEATGNAYAKRISGVLTMVERVTEEVAREALRKASTKLPVKTNIITRYVLKKCPSNPLQTICC